MKFKLQLNSTLSDSFIALYLFAFLFFRFQIENQFQGRYLISLLFGGLTLFFLWVMIKKKILNPNYFGLLGKSNNSNKKIQSKI